MRYVYNKYRIKLLIIFIKKKLKWLFKYTLFVPTYKETIINKFNLIIINNVYYL